MHFNKLTVPCHHAHWNCSAIVTPVPDGAAAGLLAAGDVGVEGIANHADPGGIVDPQPVKALLEHRQMRFAVPGYWSAQVQVEIRQGAGAQDLLFAPHDN